jgi:hypothetical protein
MSCFTERQDEIKSKAKSIAAKVIDLKLKIASMQLLNNHWQSRTLEGTKNGKISSNKEIS